MEDESLQENGIHDEGLCDKQSDKHEGEESEDEQEQDDFNDGDNIEDDIDGEDEITNEDESSKQNTEEDDSQETVQSEILESNLIKAFPLMTTSSKPLNGKINVLSENETVTSRKKKKDTVPETTATVSDYKSIEMCKSKEHVEVNNVKVKSGDSVPLKSIETSVITSPLKLVNVSETKQVHDEKIPSGVTALNITKKHEDSGDQILKPLDKLSSKSFSFSSTEIQTAHSKLSVKPIDQLAANLVRMQSEKLEKPIGAKSLEKIAENLARSGSIVGNVINGDDDRLPQDFCARSQMEKTNVHARENRGMDLSTSPRGWESTSEQNKPMDFSGIDLSSRKFNKPMDMLSSGYRTQDFQHREMDLSTKKLNKPEVTSLPYDARAVMMRNHAMVADLSKRQMSFPSYDMSSAPYHNAARIPNKDDHRLPNYTILPDPSKLTALRMNTTPVKRSLEADDLQQDMLKRIRADVIPIQRTIDKRPMIGATWRDEIGEAIEEPVMMIQGEGSGSDCDAVNPGLGEAVEEPIIFFYGEGSGEECQTGNPGDSTSADNKESNESKNEADSATSSLSTNKSFSEGSLINEVSAESLVTSKSAIKLNRNYPQSNINVKSNFQIVGSTQEKPKFKPTLGIQIIPKNTNSSVKRLSRWDVGKPEEKPECDSSIISNEENISQRRNKIECEDSSSENQDVKIDGNSLNTEDITSQQSNVKLENLQENIGEGSAIQKQSPTDQDSIQCDSSISLCQADTSETSKSCTKTTSVTENDKTNIKNVCGIESTTSHETSTSEKMDNECKPSAVSPPRFFFGPNCISYTSKTEIFESQPDHTVSTSIESKSDTLQYECVSSSRPAEDTINSYKSDDFDVTQTNNNSLKINLYKHKATNPLCEDDNKHKIEKIEGAANSWEPSASSKYSLEQPSKMPEAEISLLNPESVVEIKEDLTSCTIDTVLQDSISSTETATKECIKFEETEMSDTISQPHSTNDLIKKDVDMKMENAVITPSELQVNLSIESTQPTASKQECDIFEEQNKESDSVDDIVKSLNSSIPCSEAEACCKSSELSSEFKENKLEADSVSSKSSCSSSDGIQNFQKNNFTESEEHTSETECFVYQETNNLAKKEIDYISQKTDSSFTICEENNENRDDPKYQNQKEELIEFDNKTTRDLVESDAESMLVNCNESNEEINRQNEVLEDSENEEKKVFIDPFIKNFVPDVNAKLDSIDNSTVTSSEFIEKCNKDTLVPTISSSDDSCIHQDTSFHESVKLNSEKSSFKDECPTYDILPETVPDTNISNSSSSNIVDSTKESNVVQAAISEGQSSCIDQDLNKDVIRDYNLSKGEQGSTKLYEGQTCSNENLSSNENACNDSLKLQSSSLEPNDSGIISEKEKTEDVNFVDIQQKFHTVIEPTTSTNNTIIEPNKTDDTTQCKDVTEYAQDSYQEDQKQAIVSNILEETNSKTAEKSEIEQEELKHTEINPVDPQELINSEIKQSLVANYESSDFDDSNDDVFEAFETETIENKSNVSSNLDETMSDAEENEEKNIEKSSKKNEILSNEVQAIPVDKETESTIDSSGIEQITVEKNEQKQKGINEETAMKGADFNVVQHDLNQEIAVDEKVHVNSEKSNTVELSETETSTISSEINPVNKECINLELNKANNLINILKEGKKESLDEVTKDVVDVVSVEKTDFKIDSTNEIETLELNNSNNEITPEDLRTELSLKSTEENLVTSLDNDVKFMKNEEVKHVTEELSIIETCNKVRKSSEHGDKENKFDINSQEEKNFNKEECNVSIHSVSNILPLKFDNIEKSEIHKNNISVMSENFKPMDNLQFVSFMSEKSENSDVIDNHENHNKSLCVTNETIESISESTVTTGVKDGSTSFSMQQEITSEPIIAINDYKKEASKRFSDVSDLIQDVPPLKSKPPCIEPPNEQILEDLSNSKVQLDKNLDNFKQMEMAVHETKAKDDMIMSDNSVVQSTKDDCHTVANVLNNILNQVERKNNETNEEKESTDIQSVEIKTVSLISDDSMGADNENLFGIASEEMDPLACTDDETIKKLDDTPKIALRVKPVSELVYDGWKLDSTEPPKLSRKRRNSSHESNSEDGGMKEDEVMMGGKRMKLRGKRMADKQLRKSVEESRVVTISSEDEAVQCDDSQELKEQESKDASDDQSAAHLSAIDRKSRGRPRGRRRRGYKGSGRSNRSKHSEFQSSQVSETSPEVIFEGTPPSNNDSLNMTPVSQKKRKKSEFLIFDWIL